LFFKPTASDKRHGQPFYREDVKGPDKIEIVYFFPRNELINLIVRVDFSVFKFSLGNLKVCVGIDMRNRSRRIKRPVRRTEPMHPAALWSIRTASAAPVTAWSDGRPADSRPPMSRHQTPHRIPLPSALEQASLAAKWFCGG
jgi:hypothetical protein